jgi:hypothetical protein
MAAVNTFIYTFASTQAKISFHIRFSAEVGGLQQRLIYVWLTRETTYNSCFDVQVYNWLLNETCRLNVQEIPTDCGPGSSVGVVTDYALNGPGIASRWGRDFPQPSRPALGPTQPPVQWVKFFSRGKLGRGVMLTTLLVPGSWKSRAIPLPTLWATPGL